ncbi:GPR1/FUN34/yaaH family protein [Metarhizium robertsii]|uniref:GPR1/FUN34/yaaH family protein n=1 Tax=Metarhizium robertsii TaxID=568076 RepID=A0A014PIH0_9HYPO|nr:GPR1/FUN34/yaaH family protein [Metarhizium robertsii]
MEFSTEETQETALRRLRSADTVIMSPELFERLYLQPISSVKGDLRKTFGNPTPLGLIGFCVTLTPLACSLMGWRGSGGLGAGNMFVCAYYYYFNGLISGILEFFLGNSFPFLVFTTYGCVILAFAATLHPFYNSASAYSPDGNFAEGLREPSFTATFAFFPITLACLNAIFMICATKINLVFLSVFAGASLGFTLLAATLWTLSKGAIEASARLLVPRLDEY